MRCWEKRRYQTNDYRGQQKLLVKVEHLQHAKWEQNQVHLSLILPPLPPPHPTPNPTPTTGIRPAFGSWPFQFSSPNSAYFVTPTSNFVYGARTLHPSARCPPTRYVVFLLAFFLRNFLMQSSCNATVFHPYVTSPTIKQLIIKIFVIIIFLSCNRPSDMLRTPTICLEVSLLTLFFGDVVRHLSWWSGTSQVTINSNRTNTSIHNNPLKQSRNFPAFTEQEGSFQRPQQLDNYPYPQPDKCPSLHHFPSPYSLFINSRRILIL